MDDKSGIQHTLTSGIEVNYLQSVVEGSITYDGADPHCSGKDSMVDGQRIKNLLTTESLEFTIREVTVREEYKTGDIIIRENGVSIPAAYKQNGGMTNDFGTLFTYYTVLAVKTQRQAKTTLLTKARQELSSGH